MNINDTVASGLRDRGLHGYTTSAAPIVDALVAREQQIAAGIVSAASRQGIDERTTRSTLAGLGMHVPQPVQAVRPQAAQAATPEAGQAQQDSTVALLHEAVTLLKKIAKRTKSI